MVTGSLFLDTLTELLRVSVAKAEKAVVGQVVEVIREYPFPGKLRGRVSGRLNEAGRFWERTGDRKKALAVYTLSDQPPSRERRCRILSRQGMIMDALKLADTIVRDPWDDDELDFALNFRAVNGRKLGIQYPEPEKITFSEELLTLERNTPAGIEEQVLKYFSKRNYQGYFAENVLWNRLFGLACWDIVFMPLPNVFFHPFQRGPADLFTPGFYRLRKTEFDRRFAEIRSYSHWGKNILERYREKEGTANLLVSWKKTGYGQLEQFLGRISNLQLADVLEHMAPRLRELGSGFPDLLLLGPDPSEFLLVEVKGPGDQLRPNQLRWLTFFREKGIPSRIARVRWKEQAC